MVPLSENGPQYKERRAGELVQALPAEMGFAHFTRAILRGTFRRTAIHLNLAELSTLVQKFTNVFWGSWGQLRLPILARRSARSLRVNFHSKGLALFSQ